MSILKRIKMLIGASTDDVETIITDSWLDKDKKYAIYLLSDTKMATIAKYLIQNGVEVYKARSNMEEVVGQFVMDVEPAILVYADTGKGTFLNSKSQEQLISVLGAADIKMNKAAIVFYSDSATKVAALDSLEGQECLGSIRWLKYRGTKDILEKIKGTGLHFCGSKDEIEVNLNGLGVMCKEYDSGSDIKEKVALKKESIENIEGIYRKLYECIRTTDNNKESNKNKSKQSKGECENKNTSVDCEMIKSYNVNV